MGSSGLLRRVALGLALLAHVALAGLLVGSRLASPVGAVLAPLRGLVVGNAAPSGAPPTHDAMIRTARHRTEGMRVRDTGDALDVVMSLTGCILVAGFVLPVGRGRGIATRVQVRLRGPPVATFGS